MNTNGYNHRYHRSKVALENMLRDAAQETQRQQLALDEEPTVEEARQQLSTEIRRRRKLELQLETAENFGRLQPMPTESESREELIAKAKGFLEKNGFLVVPLSVVESNGYVVKANGHDDKPTLYERQNDDTKGERVKTKNKTAQEFKSLLKQLNLNQTQIAEMLEFSSRTARRYKRGEVEVPASTLKLMRMMANGVEAVASA